jgi:penicillin-binding protein 2
MTRRRRRLPTRLGPVVGRRPGLLEGPVGRGSGARRRTQWRRRRWFKPAHRTGPPMGARARSRLEAWRRALRAQSVRRRARPAKPARRPPPRQPRMRPRKSLSQRMLPSGEPSPPRTVVRLRVTGLVVAALFSLMFVRLWYLQVLDTSSYSRTVTANQLRPVEVPAARGLILDRNGAELVGDQVTEDITLSRVSAEQHPAVVSSLATLLGVSVAQIQADLANPQYSLYKPVPILTNAPMQDVLYIGEHASQFPGVSTVADTNRTYPMGQTGAQMLGYLGQIQKLEPGYQLGDVVGLSGLEAQYQSALRGTPGTERVEVDAAGQVVGSLGEIPPVPGDDLVTNIDTGLEQTLQSALDAQVAQLHSKGGAAVAMDPQTGAVLAMVSSPTYDPSWWTPNGITEAHYQQLQQNGSLNNYAIDGLYTPGSTFKLATATAALNDGLITPGYYFDDPGTYRLGNAVFHDALGEAPGPINITTAITISSDDFFYNLGVMFWDDYKTTGKYGETPIQDAANQLGYGDVTGIDLPGETTAARVDSPQVVAKEHQQDPAAYPDGSWYAGNNLEMAFGQGGTVITPIEQAVAYSTFANGGTRYVPQIGAGLVDPGGKVVKTFTPKVADHVNYSPADYQAMLAGFQGVVDNPAGTAYAPFVGFPLSTFPLGGKTGTASVAGGQPTSWFVGFGPLPHPQYVITAVISGGGYGEAAAAPVVRQAFDYVVAHPESPVHLALPPSPPGSSSCPPPSSSSGASGASVPSGRGPGPTTTTTTACPHQAGAAPTASAARRAASSPGGTALTSTSSASSASDRPRAPPPSL